MGITSPNWYGKHVDGVAKVCWGDYETAISEGCVYNHTVWSKIGFNADVQTAEELIYPLSGTYTWPTGATVVTLESSDNTQDKTGGSGALGITLYYLDTGYIEKTVTVVLSGTTAVACCSDFYRFLNMRVSSVGSGGVPVGNISLKSGATTYGYIRLGKTRARQLTWTVPKGKTLYVTDFDTGVVHSAANKYSVVTLKATYDEKSGSLLTAGVHFMPFAEMVNSGIAISKHFTCAKRFPEKTDVMVTGSSSGTATIEAYLGGWVETE